MTLFEDVYREYERDLRRLSKTHTLPGMDADDVHSEMMICLWKATTTYRAGDTSFAGYWWSIWLNRRRDILRTFYAHRQGDVFYTDDLPEQVVVDEVFPSINHQTWEERVAWLMLGTGCTATEVQQHMSRRRYYSIVESWRTPAVRNALRKD